MYLDIFKIIDCSVFYPVTVLQYTITFSFYGFGFSLCYPLYIA